MKICTLAPLVAVSNQRQLGNNPLLPLADDNNDELTRDHVTVACVMILCRLILSQDCL